MAFETILIYFLNFGGFFFDAYNFFNRYVLFLLENMDGQSFFKAAKINLVAFTFISHTPELAISESANAYLLKYVPLTCTI